MPNQVLIEATIAEVTLYDDLKFGVRGLRLRLNPPTGQFVDTCDLFQGTPILRAHNS